MDNGGWASGGNKITATSTLDYGNKHNLNQQQDSTTATNSTKQSENEFARLTRAVVQRKSKYFWAFCVLYVMNTNEPKGKQEDYLTGNRGI
jgi:hypothetical protein